MTRLQLLTRDLRQQLETYSKTLGHAAAPELAGAISSLSPLLDEVDDLEDRVELIEARLDLLEGHPYALLLPQAS